MSERKKERQRGLALLEQLKPPEWMDEMRRYYLQHGRFRPEDLARLMGTGGRTTESPAQPEHGAAELLQHLATKRRE